MVQQVINAATTPRDRLHAALYLSAGLVIGAGILTAVTLRPPRKEWLDPGGAEPK